MDSKVLYLGPWGTTFTHSAYRYLSNMVPAAPVATRENYIPVDKNDNVIASVIKHGGWGAVAFRTLAKGRVSPAVESIVGLLQRGDQLPISVVAAVEMKIHFCLMVRSGVTNPVGILCHQESLGACKEIISRLGLPTEEVSSNGEAARRVAEESKYANWAALGPVEAVQYHNLTVLYGNCESKKAVTSFLLLGPKDALPQVGDRNLAFLVFETKNLPGALLLALLPLALLGLNMIQIHSVHIENGTYHFIAEVEVPRRYLGISRFALASKIMKCCTSKLRKLRPFKVVKG